MERIAGCENYSLYISLRHVFSFLPPFFPLTFFFLFDHISKDFATVGQKQIQYRIIIYQKTLLDHVQLPALLIV